jgi:hypothetical protein
VDDTRRPALDEFAGAIERLRRRRANQSDLPDDPDSFVAEAAQAERTALAEEYRDLLAAEQRIGNLDALVPVLETRAKQLQSGPRAAAALKLVTERLEEARTAYDEAGGDQIALPLVATLLELEDLSKRSPVSDLS